jgi:hypothetical protein
MQERKNNKKNGVKELEKGAFYIKTFSRKKVLTPMQKMENFPSIEIILLSQNLKVCAELRSHNNPPVEIFALWY